MKREEVVVENNIPLEVKWGIGVMPYWFLGTFFITPSVVSILSVIENRGFINLSNKSFIAFLLHLLPILYGLLGIYLIIAHPYELKVIKRGILLNYLLFKIFIPNERIDRIQLREIGFLIGVDPSINIRIILSKNFLFIVDCVCLYFGRYSGFSYDDNGEIYVLEAMVSYYLKLKMEREWEDKL